MEFVEPETKESETPTPAIAPQDAETNRKTEEAVEKLEDEIDKAYSAVETWWSQTLSKLQIDQHKQEILDHLAKAKANISNKAAASESLNAIEDKLKSLSVPDNVRTQFETLNANVKQVDLKKPLEALEAVKLDDVKRSANSALDALDSQLEKVENAAGAVASSFFSYFSNIVSVQPGGETTEKAAETTETKIVQSPKDDATLSFVKDKNYGSSRLDNDLYKLHTSEESYIGELSETEQKAIALFDVDSKTQEVSELLEKYPNTLDRMMNSLVPVKIAYNVFWFRYFTEEKKIRDADKKRQELLEKPATGAAGGGDDDDDDFTWDDDDEDDDKEQETP